MITLPKDIQQDLTTLFTTPNIKEKRVTPLNILNHIRNSNKIYPNLFIWLFDNDNLNVNQMKLINLYLGEDYKFSDQKYKYLYGSKIIIKHTLYPNEIEWLCSLRIDVENDQYLFTRDEINDSPFDVSKLIEVPYETQEDIN